MQIQNAHCVFMIKQRDLPMRNNLCFVFDDCVHVQVLYLMDRFDMYLYCQQAKEWIKSFVSLATVTQGYQKSKVTPYMHVLATHVPDMIRQHRNIKQFSCQGGKSNL